VTPAALFEQYHYLPAHVGKKLWGRLRRRVDGWDDLLQAGNIGLWKAANAYDPSWGNAFMTCAYAYVLNEMRDTARRGKSVITVPNGIGEKRYAERFPESIVAAQLAWSAVQLSFQDRETTDPDATPFLDVRAALRLASPADRCLLCRHFGIGQKPETMTQIAATAGVSQQGIHQRIHKALSRLREHLTGYETPGS
jgi:RNA polymerase sigma factor (sigma-70 family)